ncbi:MAG: 5-formyltetrahydrofolate cyclo-ligase [Luteibaculaceae bacterium]
MTKAELRKIFLEKRKQIPVEPNSERIAQLILPLLPANAKVLQTFIPIEKKHEVNTWKIIEQVAALNTQTTWVAPVINPKNETLSFYPFTKDNLELKSFGVLEPSTGNEKPVQESEIDFWIIPLLACDTKGYRVGYGKGYYDKALKKAKTEAVFIGVSWFEPIEKIDDINEFDVPLHFLVTPTKLHKF